eukprot:Gb_08356 [translate_table: standard]
MSENLTTSRYPIKSNNPPYKRKHCICRFQPLCYAGTFSGRAFIIFLITAIGIGILLNTRGR